MFRLTKRFRNVEALKQSLNGRRITYAGINSKNFDETKISDFTKSVEFVNKYEPLFVATYRRQPIVLKRGKGCLLYDLDDNEYIDLTSGIAVCNLGYSDEAINNIIREQGDSLLHSSNIYFNEWAGHLAQSLIEATAKEGKMKEPWQVFFSNSGTEANEGAIKFCRKYGKIFGPEEKFEVVSFTNAFHGRTMGALSATSNKKYKASFEPLIPGFKMGRFNDVIEARSLISKHTAGVIVEPIQGEGGINLATEEFLISLRELCDQNNAVLIYDEIQCGLGRSGRFWAHSHYKGNVGPDIITVSKSLANGLPAGAIITNKRVGNTIEIADHGTTFGGNPFVCRVARNVIERLSSVELLSQVCMISKKLFDGLYTLKRKYPSVISEIRGRGLIIGVQVTSDPQALVKICLQNKLLILAAGADTIRLLPPLIIDNNTVEKSLERLDCSINEWCQTM